MGQAKKRRFCPAIQKDITAAECGENRLSRYACPENCPFNPFSAANYDLQLEIEDRLDAAMLPAAASEASDPAALSDRIHAAARANPAHGQHAAFLRFFFFDRNASGQTFATRWAAGGLARERNDVQVLFRGKRQMRVALLELRQIVNDREFSAVDLLDPDPKPLRFVDRSVAATSVRFATILTWIFPTPHFWRMSGTGIGFNDIAPLPPLEVLDASIRHLHGPDGLDARRQWLAENFARIDDVLRATGYARRQEMFTAMDATFGTATYELRGPLPECHAALAAVPDVEREEVAPEDTKKGFDSAYVWLDRDRQGDVPLPGRRILGRIVLGPAGLRVDVAGGARLDELRRRIEELLGGRVAFVKERRDDLAGQMLSLEPSFDPKLVPARLLENPTRWDISTSRLPAPPKGVDPDDAIAAAHVEMRQRQLDEPIPALGNCTPREAAARPDRRAALIEWVKGMVRLHDKANLKSGRTDDINAFIRSLGLVELDVPPPPPREIPVEDEDVSDDDEYDDEDGEFADLEDFGEDDFETDEDFEHDEAEAPHGGARTSEWSAPPLPDKPLSFEEVLARLRQSLDAFDTAGAAIAELGNAAPTVLDDLWSLAEPMMTQDEFSVVVLFVVQIWFALVPRGHAPRLSYDRILAGIDQRWKRLDRQGKPSPAGLQKLMTDSPQPDLLAAVAEQLIESVEKGPRSMRLSPKASMHALIMLSSLIAELDRALRE